MIPDKILTHFDDHLYVKIRMERQKVGYPVANLNIKLEDHPLLGRKVLQDGEIGFIEDVRKHYYHGGWYIAVVLNFSGSHCMRPWENINCPDELMISIIDETQVEVKLL